MTTEPNIAQGFRGWLRSDMRTLRWVFLTLYLLLLAGLSIPFFFNDDLWVTGLILVSVLLASQGLLLLGAGTITLCRPIRRRRLVLPIFAASFMFAVLAFGFALAMFELSEIEKHFQGSDDLLWLGFWMFVAASWLVWGVLLWFYVRDRERLSVMGRLAAACFAGSLAELLACVPSHVITSRRPQCLAGIGTMLGIIAGLYVMIFSLGPMIVVLFLRPCYRRERLELDAKFPTCPRCGYDLTGTFAAGRGACPECGAALRGGAATSSI